MVHHLGVARNGVFGYPIDRATQPTILLTEPRDWEPITGRGSAMGVPVTISRILRRRIWRRATTHLHI